MLVGEEEKPRTPEWKASAALVHSSRSRRCPERASAQSHGTDTHDSQDIDIRFLSQGDAAKQQRS
jgi:hypothetical protein